MSSYVAAGLIVLSFGLLSAQQDDVRSPIASSPVVEVKGTIARVQITRGQGMPYLEVKHAERTTKVMLGSIRYLMEQNFNPKAGQEVTVKGYKVDGDVVAITVNLRSEGKILRLRDKNGWPVWRRGHRGRANP